MVDILLITKITHYARHVYFTFTSVMKIQVYQRKLEGK